MNTAEYSAMIYGWLVTVDKDGGGTLGQAYEGDWTVSVMNGPVFVLDGETLRTGMPKTHDEVAYLAYEFAVDSDESDV
jgi:hypothetical protein